MPRSIDALRGPPSLEIYAKDASGPFCLPTLILGPSHAPYQPLFASRAWEEICLKCWDSFQELVSFNSSILMITVHTYYSAIGYSAKSVIMPICCPIFWSHLLICL